MIRNHLIQMMEQHEMKVIPGQLDHCRFDNCEGSPIIEGFCSFHYNLICQHESRYLLQNIAFLLQNILDKLDETNPSTNQNVSVPRFTPDITIPKLFDNSPTIKNNK